MRGVLVVPHSDNRKIGKAAATYVGQASCPPSCPLLHAGCYAEHGPLGIHTRRINRSAYRRSPFVLAQQEAHLIGKLDGDKPLRLHVVGDTRQNKAAAILAKAAASYRNVVWTYTHAWRTVRRSSWGRISVLASVEGWLGAMRAWRRGYAPAMVVDRFPTNGKAYRVGGWKVVPCPAQTRGRTCVECKLCFRDSFLHSHRIVIAFEAHGSRQNVVRGRLE